MLWGQPTMQTIAWSRTDGLHNAIHVSEKIFMIVTPPGVVLPAFPSPLSSPSHSPIVSRSWSQCALSCSRSRSTLASLRPRLSSGCECTMLCSAAAARALAALLPRVLPSNPGSLSLPCSSCMSSGRQPAGRNGHGYK